MDQMMVRADMIPPLTTVRQPAMEMGHAAAHTTLTPFDTELIIRESVARHL